MKREFAICASIIMLLGMANFCYAKHGKERSLPPGLQKKMERGQSLPPGWQKKLVVGHVLDRDIYERGKIIATNNKGLVTVSIDGKLVKLVKDTREIVEILSGR